MLIVKELENTCMACPSQWEGKTVANEEVYIRYRWGTLRVDLNGETIFSADCGDAYDGSMETDEMLELTGIRLI